MMGWRTRLPAAAAIVFVLGLMPVDAAPDPLASPVGGAVDLGAPAASAAKPAVKRRRTQRPHPHRPTELGAQTIPDFGRPAITGVAVLGPALRDYPELGPEPRDDAAAFSPAFYLDGIARFVTQPPPPLECRPQRRGDAGLPGYIPGAPLYCAQRDP